MNDHIELMTKACIQSVPPIGENGNEYLKNLKLNMKLGNFGNILFEQKLFKLGQAGLLTCASLGVSTAVAHPPSGNRNTRVFRLFFGIIEDLNK